MRIRTSRLALAAVLVAGTLVTATAALADPGPGTWTKITSPAAPGATFLYRFKLATTATNQIIVSGTTSATVTHVDIDCVVESPAESIQLEQLASGVAVVNGTFSAVGTLSQTFPQCRLRAVPTGVDATTAYLGSYSGPAMYEWAGAAQTDTNDTPYGLTAVDEQGTSWAEAIDAGECGAGILANVETPGMELDGPGQLVCVVGLGVGNVTASGTANASSVKVDGHNAYLPFEVHNLRIGLTHLTVAQVPLTTTFTRSSAGVLTWTESAPLVRCSVSDTYPPTTTTCPSLTNTGVTFERTGTIDPSGPKVRMQDAYVSSDGKAHTVNPNYEGSAETPPTGAVGYLFPGHGSTFAVATSNEAVTGFGTKAATIMLRSDLYALDGDPSASAYGVTFSRAPSKLVFKGTNDGSEPDEYQMDYSLSVPAHGTSYIRFVATEGVTVADVKALGSSAVGGMVNAPKITSPKSGATITGHAITVKGTVSVGANGLPTAVTVNGHKATLSSTGSFSVKLTAGYGKHTLTATATDSAGNPKSTAITVTNKA